MFKIKRQQAAGANCSAMEQRPFQKRVQLKNQRSRRNIFKFCALFFFFIFGFVSTSNAQFFYIKGLLNSEDETLIGVDFDKNSLTIIVTEMGGSIEYKIENMKIDDADKSVAFFLNDYFGNGEFNLMLFLPKTKSIIWGSRSKGSDSAFPIRDLKNSNGGTFDFTELYNAAKKKTENKSKY